jgi:hypothetical protein
MPLNEEQESVLSSLQEKSEKSKRNARKNYRTAYACHLLAIAASLVATIMAASASAPGAATAIVTAIPGTALLFNSIFAFDRKANWYRKKKLRYDGLALEIQYESKSVGDAAKEIRIFEEEIEKEYPGFGAFPRSENGR